MAFIPSKANIHNEFGICGWILTVLSYILIFLTLPISACMSIKVVQEYERAVIFRLGRLLPGGAKGPGIFFIVPCIDTYRKVDLRVLSFEVPPQEILSKDSVTVAVDAVVYFRISNATISVTNVEDASRSTKLLAQTTLRNILGTKTLAEMLSDREAISLQMQRANAVKCSFASLKYYGWTLLLFNAMYGIVLYLLHAPFSQLVHQLLPFFIAYSASLLLALLAIRLQLPLLLYPLLITTIPFIMVPLFIATLYFSQHFCLLVSPLFHANASSFHHCPTDMLARPFPAAFSFSASDQPLRITPRSSLASFFLRIFSRMENQPKFGKATLGRSPEKRGDQQESVRRQKKTKCKSIVRQSIVESPVEDRAEADAGSDEEEMVYDNRSHRSGGTPSSSKSNSPISTVIPTVPSSKRVIA
uniref:PHB domain-containing protein n=1 Tax=Globodera pallida TaxID=36090 RepID=A0A183CDI9_GLOPA